MTTGRAAGRRGARANRLLLQAVRERSVADEGALVASIADPHTSCSRTGCGCDDLLVDAAPRPQPPNLEALRRQRFERSLVAATGPASDGVAAVKAIVDDLYATTRSGKMPTPAKVQQLLDTLAKAGVTL